MELAYVVKVGGAIDGIQDARGQSRSLHLRSGWDFRRCLRLRIWKNIRTPRPGALPTGFYSKNCYKKPGLSANVKEEEWINQTSTKQVQESRYRQLMMIKLNLIDMGDYNYVWKIIYYVRKRKGFFQMIK